MFTLKVQIEGNDPKMYFLYLYYDSLPKGSEVASKNSRCTTEEQVGLWTPSFEATDAFHVTSVLSS
jgi:hypothetical protein